MKSLRRKPKTAPPPAFPTLVPGDSVVLDDGRHAWTYQATSASVLSPVTTVSCGDPACGMCSPLTAPKPSLSFQQMVQALSLPVPYVAEDVEEEPVAEAPRPEPEPPPEDGLVAEARRAIAAGDVGGFVRRPR